MSATGPNFGKGAGIAFLRALIGHQGDECVTWPMSQDGRGYGVCAFEGCSYKAHRLMCVLAHGEPPTPKHQAAHSCGNGHLRCVNPRHLSWKTMTENAADMVAHGTARFDRGRRYRLTVEQVQEILALKGKMTQRAIAAMYGVKDKQISKIHLGQCWRGGVYNPPGGLGDRRRRPARAA